MKKRLKAVTCAVVAMLSLSLAVDSPKAGLFGVDVVSAATTGAAASTTKASRILKVGSRGSEVKALQSKLNEHGYILKVDGIFGKLTLAAVKSFQSKNGLGADGLVGSKTFEKLYAQIATEKPVTPEPPAVTPEPPAVTPEPPTTPDAVTSASIVDNEAAFLKAVSTDGTWIACALNDLTIDQDIVLEGGFVNKDKPARKIALYTQDADHNVLERFTLTAPKLVIRSENTRLQGGTFVGDVYVEANGFTIRDAKVEGNVYFAKEEYQSTFDASNAGVVTGVTEVKVEVDAVSTASIVDNKDAFLKAVSKDGSWIAAALNNLTFDQDIVLEGAFTNKEKPARKIALYTQDADHNRTASFTLIAPKLIVRSENTRLQGGTFIGDVYVEANGFTIRDAKVQGNVYFANEGYKSTFDGSNKAVVTGVVEVKPD